MQRRHFLKAGLGVAALGIAGFARADAHTTYERFHAALARDPELTVYANLEGNQQGHAHVEGEIPAELQGTFFRNGPGRFELGGERYHHWFDGDGFAQAWRIGNGTVTHQGRFVETRKFLDESAAGQFLYPAFGTNVARRGFRDNDSLNTANTNLLPFNDRLYALWEGGSATELDPACRSPPIRRSSRTAPCGISAPCPAATGSPCTASGPLARCCRRAWST
jgi:all-trans-8'-apo-beta-carotenal 15,15'-oxygenase